MCIQTKLTVFFEDPFWVGVLERIDGDRLEAVRVVFGGEPKNYEIYSFFIQNWSTLKFSPIVKTKSMIEKRINPKRIQRQIQDQLGQKGVGTKAQQALKLQHEENKSVRLQRSQQEKEDAQQRKFELKQKKRKEKHRGR